MFRRWLVVWAALAAGLLILTGSGFAQQPPAEPPQGQPAPAPGPAPSPPEQPSGTPAPPAPGPTPAPQAGDAFGEEVTLPERRVIYMTGTANWDSAFETLVDAFKQVVTYLDRQGLKPSGPMMTIYTSTDDTGFQFQAAVPIADDPKDPPKGDIALGKSPAGRAFKFVHRGSYDAMDTTYDAITNFLDEKRLEARELFIEEYANDPTKTPEDELIVNVYVPVK
jgi:effector-binding domain-containing protein